ncbi:MAG: hypothetical protein ICV83_23590, partial [Cytophagales bacterium]|nr:hypothetical protein [Cytophagales bacterium]
TGIVAFLGERLPDYMIPASFVQLDAPAFPVTGHGKVDVKALPDPGAFALTSQTQYLPPRTPTERQLAAIWQEVLRKDKIGMLDNFFELGGHSLKAVQLVSRIKKVFDVNLKLVVVFLNPTVEKLAAELDNLAYCKRESDPGEPAPHGKDSRVDLDEMVL